MKSVKAAKSSQAVKATKAAKVNYTVKFVFRLIKILATLTEKSASSVFISLQIWS